MTSKYKFTAEQIQELTKAAKANNRKDVDRRLRALLMRANGKTLKEVASATGYSPGHIIKFVTKYLEGGLAAMTGDHRRGNRRNMSFEEESALLEPFKKRAKAGQIVKVSEIESAYQEAVGHSIGTAQIYYVLHRHGWKKPIPRYKNLEKTGEGVVDT